MYPFSFNKDLNHLSTTEDCSVTGSSTEQHSFGSTVRGYLYLQGQGSNDPQPGARMNKDFTETWKFKQFFLFGL
jgi:hypothetical protein